MGDYEDPQDEGRDDEFVPPAAGWTDALQAQFGSVPWWVLSALIHVGILFLTALITVAGPTLPSDEMIIPMDLVEDQQYEPEEVIKDVVERKYNIEAPTEVEHPIIPHEEYEITDHMETENNMDDNTARGQEDAISDIPLGGPGVVSNLGIGAGSAGCFGFRSGGGRRKCVARFGGSKASEKSVNQGLEWLARHQEPEGNWLIQKWDGSHSDDGGTLGVTGLATLAFLGAGHTEVEGQYRQTVRRAIEYMINQQQAGGAIKSGYNHAIAGLALAEAYGMGKVKRTREAAQKAVTHSANEHQMPGSAWRYSPRIEPDTSVTGWFVMQLKSGMIAGLDVNPDTFKGAIAWLDQVTDMPGGGGNYVGTARYRPESGPTQNMTAVGALCRQFMGWKRDAPVLIGAADYLMDRLPEWENARGWSFYYWYYGTLVMFQMGGRWWKAWNAAMRDMLIQNQRKDADPQVEGSWDPIADGERAGRAYTTALAVLCLEVYYRYLPIYKN